MSWPSSAPRGANQHTYLDGTIEPRRAAPRRGVEDVDRQRCLTADMSLLIKTSKRDGSTTFDATIMMPPRSPWGHWKLNPHHLHSCNSPSTHTWKIVRSVSPTAVSYTVVNIAIRAVSSRRIDCRSDALQGVAHHLFYITRKIRAGRMVVK